MGVSLKLVSGTSYTNSNKMSGGEGRVRKGKYLERAKELLMKYDTILVVEADNVGSKQLANIRKSLRGDAVILMGKNTLMRKAMTDVIETNPEKKKLLTLRNKIYGNVGLVFTEKSIPNIRGQLEAEKKGAVAKSGSIAPIDVNIPAGPTPLDPQQTQFMQALNIETKISRMKIEILKEVELLKKGDKVTPSQAELLRKLDMKPFEYGLITSAVYEGGDCYDAFLLDLTDDDVLKRFTKALTNVTCVTLAIGYPTILWFNNVLYAVQKQVNDFTALSLALHLPNQSLVPQLCMAGYKELMSLAVAIEHYPKLFGGKEDSLASKYKQFQEDPSAFAAAAPAPAAAAPAAEEKKEEVKEEEEDSDMDLGGLF